MTYPHYICGQSACKTDPEWANESDNADLRKQEQLKKSITSLTAQVYKTTANVLSYGFSFFVFTFVFVEIRDSAVDIV